MIRSFAELDDIIIDSEDTLQQSEYVEDYEPDFEFSLSPRSNVDSGSPRAGNDITNVSVYQNDTFCSENDVSDALTSPLGSSKLFKNFNDIGRLHDSPEMLEQVRTEEKSIINHNVAENDSDRVVGSFADRDALIYSEGQENTKEMGKESVGSRKVNFEDDKRNGFG